MCNKKIKSESRGEANKKKNMAHFKKEQNPFKFLERHEECILAWH